MHFLRSVGQKNYQKSFSILSQSEKLFSSFLSFKAKAKKQNLIFNSTQSEGDANKTQGTARHLDDVIKVRSEIYLQVCFCLNKA